jgi:ligand-binding sensor domain-containing protein
MFQKLEKDLKEIQYAKINKFFFLSLFLINILHAQADQRFDIFDWEIIGNNGSINSISEGYQYIFFATNGNGILRFNKFSRKFDQSLYLGQGIKSKKIKHVYFDKYTGILWSAGDKSLEFTSSREGNWNQVNYDRLSIKSYNDIQDLGSSSNYLWVRTLSSYLKLDHVSGTFLGLFPYPDEQVFWGDFNYRNNLTVKDFAFEDFFVENGWLLTNQGASDQNGTFSKYVSFLETESEFSWIGLSNGYILALDNFSKTVSPVSKGTEFNIPFTMSFNDKLWVAGIGNSNYNALYVISKDFNEERNFKNSNYSNFSYSDIYSSKAFSEEVWLGSEGSVIIYDQRKDFFRTLGYDKGIPVERVEFIESLDNKVYIGSRNDLIVIDKSSKKIIDSKISDLIKKNNLFIDDLKVIGNIIFLISSGKVYQFNSNEQININQYNNFSLDQFKPYAVYGNNNSKYFVSERGIVNNINEKVIPSSLYFNYRVSDIVLADNYMYIGTTGGLAIYDIKENQLHNFFDFTFLKNIFDMEQINEFLVLLTSSGLVKLKTS